MISNSNPYVMLGYRFPRLAIDESPIEQSKGADGDSNAVLKFEVTPIEPYVATERSNNRAIIEAGVLVELRLGDDSSASPHVLLAKCIAGFVGKDQKDDGNVELFLANCGEYARPLYWLARQRLTSLLTMTRMASLKLPADVDAGVQAAQPVGRSKEARRPRRKPPR